MKIFFNYVLNYYQVKKMYKNKKNKKINFDKIINFRFTIILILVVTLFGVLFISVTNVMLVNNKKYSKSLKKLSYTEITGSSSPRGRIYDRNHNIIVDNKALKTIIYKKAKGTKNIEMIETAATVAPHLDLNYSKLTDRAKREYYYAKNKDECNKLVTSKEIEKVNQRKMTQTELEELKLARIDEEKLNFSDDEKKVAYLYYLMNKSYTYETKIIKSNVSDEEYAYISEHNEDLNGFNTQIDWERVYPYGDVFRTLLGSVSASTQGLPVEE